jgi:hypothetical protein
MMIQKAECEAFAKALSVRGLKAYAQVRID